ncbi:MAG: CsbD family protein [Acidimicrobiia bacterium]
MDNEANRDKVKGRVEQAAGDLSGDDDLKRRGKIDEAAGKAKSSIDKGVDWVKDKAKD